ncbi:TetR/AcrR family transcriptional regulator [Porticoccaceae bacterium]|nr:TetR/AcrR family transcriptional regulator [Porticoccaceae bacterium]MDB9737033.1 TetR/AcrR family transcriptional regulator [Porticoccaceae bacterium]MDC1512574.1 TetR/AcrR family transcriptional regulator [Porticoccaceae bacterium]
MSKALRLTQVERKEISDAKMLEAAVDLIVERGAGQVTLKDVGEKAGYSRGLAGYRFGNREGLFDFVLRSVGDEWLGELTQVTANSFGYKAIAAALDAHIKFCEDAPKHVEAFYRLWFDSMAPDSQLKGVILGIHQRRRGDVVSWIEQAVAAGEVSATVDAGMLADHFTASVSGIVYHWMTDPDNLDEMRNLHEALKQVMHSMLRG